MKHGILSLGWPWYKLLNDSLYCCSSVRDVMSDTLFCKNCCTFFVRVPWKSIIDNWHKLTQCWVHIQIFFLKNIEIIRQKSVDTGLFEEKHFFFTFPVHTPRHSSGRVPIPLGLWSYGFFSEIFNGWSLKPGEMDRQRDK